MSIPVSRTAFPREPSLKMRAPYLLRFLAVALLLTAPYLLWFPFDEVKFVDPATPLLLSLVGVLALAGLYHSCRQSPFSLLTAHWMFVFFFFSVAPMYQLALSRTPSQAYLPQADSYGGYAALAVVVWSSIVLVLQSKGRSATIVNPSPVDPLEVTPWKVFFVSSLSFGMLFVLIGPSGLLSRAESFMSAASVSGPVTIMMFTTGRAIPLSGAILLARRWKNLRTGGRAMVVLLVLFALFANFPTGVPRYWFGSVAVGLAAMALRKRVRTGLWLPLAFTMSFLIVLPYLNTFRHAFTVDQMIAKEASATTVDSVLTSADYDAYAMLTNSVWYIDHFAPSYGRHMFSNLLFFVPSSLWPNKAGSTNELLLNASQLGHINSNLSQPLPAEFLMNFGWLGIVFGAVVTVLVVQKLDRLFWGGATRQVMSQALGISYPFMVGFFIYIMRGGFLSSFAYTCGFVAGSVIVVAFSRRKAVNPEPIALPSPRGRLLARSRRSRA